MRILLLAYEFPPSTSPQSLRWTYLAGRLAALGHEIHVVAPDIRARSMGSPRLPETVHVHRLHPGPFRGGLDWLASRRPLAASAVGAMQADGPSADAVGAIQPATLNWKGRLVERIQRGLSRFIYPDLRGEWRWTARRALRGVLRDVRPDIVLSSHEPAVTLELGLEVAALGFPWVADLGDPVLASYTPRRWRRRAFQLEEAVLDAAAEVLVTTEQARQLLIDRHGAPETHISVLPQGFDEQILSQDLAPGEARDEVLDLLYAGSFYAFRRPDALLHGVLQVPGVRLNIASSRAPESVMRAAREHPTQIRVLGYLPHTRLLDVQRRMDVLVNIANEDPCQVPGKFYEYLGAARPILHLASVPGDAAAALLSRLGRGWVCANEPGAIAAMLARIVRSHRDGNLKREIDLGMDAVEAYSWGACARRLERLLRSIPEAEVRA